MSFIEFLKKEFSINIEPVKNDVKAFVQIEKVRSGKLNFKLLANVEQPKDLAKVLAVKIDEQVEGEIVDFEDEQADKWENDMQGHKQELVANKKEARYGESGLVAFLDKEIKLPVFSFKTLRYAMLTAVVLLFAMSAMITLPAVVQRMALVKNNQLVRSGTTKVYVNNKEALANFIRNNNGRFAVKNSSGQAEFIVNENDIFDKNVKVLGVATSVVPEEPSGLANNLEDGLEKVKTITINTLKILSDKQKEQSLIINNTLADYFAK